MKTASANSKKEIIEKSLIVTTFQWFYLGLGVLALSSPLWLPSLPIIGDLNLPITLLAAAGIIVAFYCLLLSLAFFTQNSTLLIFSLVFIFFSTIASLFLLGFSLFNVKAALHGLPECTRQFKNCGAKDALVIFSFLGFITSIPLLIFNLLTIWASVKAIAARA